MGFLLSQVCNGSCFLFSFKDFICIHFGPTSTGDRRSPLVEPPIPVYGYNTPGCRQVAQRLDERRINHVPFTPLVRIKASHTTPWGWEVGPRSPIYSETDLSHDRSPAIRHPPMYPHSLTPNIPIPQRITISLIHCPECTAPLKTLCSHCR